MQNQESKRYGKGAPTRREPVSAIACSTDHHTRTCPSTSTLFCFLLRSHRLVDRSPRGTLSLSAFSASLCPSQLSLSLSASLAYVSLSRFACLSQSLVRCLRVSWSVAALSHALLLVNGPGLCDTASLIVHELDKWRSSLVIAHLQRLISANKCNSRVVCRQLRVCWQTLAQGEECVSHEGFAIASGEGVEVALEVCPRRLRSRANGHALAVEKVGRGLDLGE